MLSGDDFTGQWFAERNFSSGTYFTLIEYGENVCGLLLYRCHVNSCDEGLPWHEQGM